MTDTVTKPALYLTLQDVFNRIWQKFVVEKSPQALTPQSEYPVQRCRYRTKEGHACFIGCCIPDELYNPAIEDQRPQRIKEAFPQIYDPIFNGIHPALLRELQSIHDYATSGPAFHEEIHTELQKFAAIHTLTIPQ